jgi:3'-5' exoribonuclease
MGTSIDASTAGKSQTKEVRGVALVKSRHAGSGEKAPAQIMTLVFKGEGGKGLKEWPARLWEDPRGIGASLAVGSLVLAEGTVVRHNQEPQLRITRLTPLKASPEEIQSYIPQSTISSSLAMARIDAFMESLVEPHLKKFGIELMSDPEIRSLFERAPAAKRNHHAVVGGLLEHTLEILAMGDRIAPILRLNRDLLLLGLLLHDLGKCWEISSQPGFAYTDDGRLLGHMFLGCDAVRRTAGRIPEFPGTLLKLLQHFILSHHGEMAYGSPVLPATPEAMAVHMLDNLSGQVYAMRAAKGSDGDEWGYERNRGAQIWHRGSDPAELAKLSGKKDPSTGQGA